jgi:hypothetical protein
MNSLTPLQLRANISCNRVSMKLVFWWVRVNQRICFPPNANNFLLYACFPLPPPAGSTHKCISGGGRQGIAEMRDVNLPGPYFGVHFITDL